MSIGERMKIAFRRYLERIAKENKTLFHDGKPDCCKLNRQQQSNMANQKK